MVSYADIYKKISKVNFSFQEDNDQIVSNFYYLKEKKPFYLIQL